MTTDTISQIKGNKRKKGDFIEQYTDFILSSASTAAKRYVSKEDDFFSVALIAFDEAIESYDSSKGNFFSYATLVIKCRITDNMRKEKNSEIPLSSLSVTNNDGETEEFDMIGRNDIVSDIAIEMASLKLELSEFGIDLFDVAKQTPKTKKTKEATGKIIRYMLNNEDCTKTLLKKKELPVNLIVKGTGVHKKITERHRKYIIAAIVVLSGDYPLTAEYIPIKREVLK